MRQNPNVAVLGRFYARIDRQDEHRVRHYDGLPKSINSAGQRSDLSRAALLIAEPNAQSGFLLLRYSADGDFGGDTWHKDLDAAKQQAAFEYGGIVDWRSVESTTLDTHALAMELLGAP